MAISLKALDPLGGPVQGVSSIDDEASLLKRTEIDISFRKWMDDSLV